ncbi:MAG: hypothetical protein ABIH25_01305 [Candidatus Woesearchaeota archaeon]
MDEFIFWLIFIALIVIIGNQTRERQERETKGMTKKQKAKYFNEIKKQQKEEWGKVLGWIILIVLILISLFIGLT